MCIDCDCGGLRERERERESMTRDLEWERRLRENATIIGPRERRNTNNSASISLRLAEAPAPASCGWWRTEREGGEGARESERTQHSSGSREKQTIIIYYLCINLIAEAATKAIALRAKRATRDKIEVREREYLTSRITHNIQLINREKRVLIWIAILFNTPCR